MISIIFYLDLIFSWDFYLPIFFRKHFDFLIFFQAFKEDNKLTLDLGDTIIVIDGKTEHFWWRGQNQRTFDIGDFPRKCVQNVAGKKAKDISKPLKNSFIHAGHGTRGQGKPWGSPGQIDEVYLRNPMTPPDLHQNPDGSPNTSTEIDQR